MTAAISVMPVGRGRDFAIAEARTIEPRAPAEQRGARRRGRRTADASSMRTRNGVDQLALEHREPRRSEVRAIVGRIQLAAEARLPALVAAERRRGREHAREDLAIALVAQFRDRQSVPAEPPHQRQRHVHGCRRHRPFVGHVVERRRRVRIRRRRQHRRRAALRRGDEREAHAAVNRKDRVAIVEADDRVDGAAIEQERRSAAHP